MDELRAEATDAKGELRMKKELLADAYDRMRILIPEWQRRAWWALFDGTRSADDGNVFSIRLEYAEMVAKAERMERLVKETQAAKMELAQIRARHPEPRLTLDEASQFCDEQMEQFITLSETKEELIAQSGFARERADKEETKMRLLREELMKKEREVEKAKAKQMTGETPMLPERCVLVLVDLDQSGNGIHHVALQADDLLGVSQDEHLDICRAPGDRQRSATPPQPAEFFNLRDPFCRVRPCQIYARRRSGEDPHVFWRSFRGYEYFR